MDTEKDFFDFFDDAVNPKPEEDEEEKAGEDNGGSDVHNNEQPEDGKENQEEGIENQEEGETQTEEPSQETEEDGKPDEGGEPQEGDEPDTPEEEDPALILQRYKTLQGMFKSQKEQIEELKKQLEELKSGSGKEEEEEKKEEQPASDGGKGQEQEPEAPDMSWVSETINKNEKVKELAEELPEVASLIEESIKSVMEQYTIAMTQTLKAMLEHIDSKYAPIEQTVKETQLENHYRRIAEVHPDFETYMESPELEAWINSKPQRIAETYKEILESGTPEEVIELLNDFKMEQGIQTKTEEQKKPTQKPSKVVPQTKTTAPTAQKTVPKDDFEAAFEEALRS